MRYGFFILVLLFSVACGNKQAAENQDEPITRFGVIVAKEVVDIEAVESHSDIQTSIFAGFSSGGGVSIGLGFLLSPFKSSQSEENPIRYEVKLQDGGETTIYHLSNLFEIDDCVEITAYPDGEEEPPTMVRSKDGCN